MAGSPVLREAKRVLRPGFDEAIRTGQIPGSAEFRLVSAAAGQNGKRRYQGAALLFALGSSNEAKPEARASLGQAFEQAKQAGRIPQEAQFAVGEMIKKGTTLRWVVAIIPSWGECFGTPTVCG